MDDKKINQWCKIVNIVFAGERNISPKWSEKFKNQPKTPEERKKMYDEYVRDIAVEIINMEEKTNGKQ